MKNIFVSVGAIIALAMPAEASAQGKGYKEPGLGTLVGGREAAAATLSTGALPSDRPAIAEQPEIEAFKIGQSVAACAVAADPAGSRLFIDARGDAITTATAKLGPALSRCLGQKRNGVRGVQMHMGGHALQAMLAEAVLKRQGIRLPAAEAFDRSKYSEEWISDQPAQRVVDQMASCLVHTQPERSAAAVWSETATPGEKKAFSSLSPFFKSCLLSDASLQTNRAGLRMALATAIYNRQRTAAVGTTTPAAPVGK